MTMTRKIRTLFIAWLDWRIAAARLRIRGGAAEHALTPGPGTLNR